MTATVPGGPPFRPAPSLAEQVTAHLRHAMRDGTFRPGDRLPSESSLAAQLGVSRTVVREALARLKQDGLLESRHGIGAIVRSVQKQRAFRLDDLEGADTGDLGQLFELRAILEAEVALLAAERRSAPHLAVLERCITAMAEAVRDGRDGTAPDVSFHQELAEASGNHYLADLMRFLSDKLVEQIRTARSHSGRQAGLPERVQQEHERIFAAVSRQEPREARMAVLAHLRNAARRLGFTIPGARTDSTEVT